MLPCFPQRFEGFLQSVQGFHVVCASKLLFQGLSFLRKDSIVDTACLHPFWDAIMQYLQTSPWVKGLHVLLGFMRALLLTIRNANREPEQRPLQRGLIYRGTKDHICKDKDPTRHDFRYPLYWALEPECQILMFMWSFWPLICKEPPPQVPC